MGAAPPLLTLRDLLELACESSCSEGFRSYPRRIPWHCDDAVKVQAKAEEAAPVRLLIQAGLRRSPSRTLSSFLFPRSPGSLAAVSRLTRSLSRRLVFWRCHRGEEDDNDGDASDADERDSLGLPSPVVSSCSASVCSEHAESVAQAADLLVEAEEHASGASDESQKASTSSGGTATGSVDDGAADGDGMHKALDGDPAVGSMMEEKQQLSPVSVMDFPFHHDEGDERSDPGTCSPSSFQQCQPDLGRSSSARELLHKIRRLDGLAQQGVDPIDLEARFVASDESGVSDDTHSQSNSSTSSTDHDSAATTPATLDGLAQGVDPVDLEPRVVESDQSGESDGTQAQSNSSISTDDSAATTSTIRSDEQHPSAADDAERDHHRLFAQLLNDDDNKPAVSVDTERLLLDFFAEGLDRRRSSRTGPVLGTVKPPDDRDEWAMVHAAKKWVQGNGTQWGVEDVLFAGAAALADMDRERRWMCVGEEEREVGVAVEGLLMDALVAELVSDMAVWC